MQLARRAGQYRGIFVVSVMPEAETIACMLFRPSTDDTIEEIELGSFGSQSWRRTSCR